jgi:RNA polymerase-associated protein LEO1
MYRVESVLPHGIDWTAARSSRILSAAAAAAALIVLVCAMQQQEDTLLAAFGSDLESIDDDIEEVVQVEEEEEALEVVDDLVVDPPLDLTPSAGGGVIRRVRLAKEITADKQIWNVDEARKKEWKGTHNAIRYKSTVGTHGFTTIQSNAAFVKWSDGSVQLVIGDYAFYDTRIVKNEKGENVLEVISHQEQKKVMTKRVNFDTKLKEATLNISARREEALRNVKKIERQVFTKEELDPSIALNEFKAAQAEARKKEKMLALQQPAVAFSNYLEHSEDEFDDEFIDGRPSYASRPAFDDEDDMSRRLQQAKSDSDRAGRAVPKRKERVAPESPNEVDDLEEDYDDLDGFIVNGSDESEEENIGTKTKRRKIVDDDDDEE